MAPEWVSDGPLAKTFHLAPGHWAGHMRIYHRICLSLIQAGYSVDLAAHPASYDHLDQRVQFHSLGAQGPLNLNWRLRQRLRRSKAAFELAMHSDAQIFSFYAPEFITWAVRIKRAKGLPIIFDCMEDFEGYALQRSGIPSWMRKPLARVVRAQLNYAARNVDAIVTSDVGTARMLAAQARQILVVHNFPQLELFPDAPNNEPEKRYDLTYHGSIPRYHLQVCFAVDDALTARGRRVSWRFIGRLPEIDWFNEQVRRRNAPDRIHFTGQIPHDQIAAEVRKARIGIIPLPDRPKFHNNIPQKLFEFMALRMPVVLSDLPPSRPFVGDGACGYMVQPNDPHAYANAIIRLLDDPQLRRTLGNEGRRRVEREYNWEMESHKYLDLYADLVRAPKHTL
ncbi:MAG: glycosyltransferase family 4 protein [Roseiflexaceae bacterium]|nr:glycosyltransferase family 4 protein [Roseiflexaceae bacterium]